MIPVKGSATVYMQVEFSVHKEDCQGRHSKITAIVGFEMLAPSQVEKESSEDKYWD